MPSRAARHELESAVVRIDHPGVARLRARAHAGLLAGELARQDVLQLGAQPLLDFLVDVAVTPVTARAAGPVELLAQAFALLLHGGNDFV